MAVGVPADRMDGLLLARSASIQPPRLSARLSPFPCSPCSAPPTIRLALSPCLCVVCSLNGSRNRGSSRHSGRTEQNSQRRHSPPLRSLLHSPDSPLAHSLAPLHSDMSASRAASASSSSSGSAASSHFEKMRAVDRLAPANVKHNHDVVFFTSVAVIQRGKRKGEEEGLEGDDGGGSAERGQAASGQLGRSSSRSSLFFCVCVVRARFLTRFHARSLSTVLPLSLSARLLPPVRSM